MSIPQIGEKAPDFSGVNQKGKTVSLADFAGKKLVLYFYPKDDTPGCTAQACNSMTFSTPFPLGPNVVKLLG